MTPSAVFAFLSYKCSIYLKTEAKFSRCRRMKHNLNYIIYLFIFLLIYVLFISLIMYLFSSPNLRHI